QTDVQSGALNVTDVTMSGPVRNREGASFSNTGGVLAGDLDNRGDASVDRTNVTGKVSNTGNFTVQSGQLADLVNFQGKSILRDTYATNVVNTLQGFLDIKDTVIANLDNNGHLKYKHSKFPGMPPSPDGNESDAAILAGRIGLSDGLSYRMGDSEGLTNRAGSVPKQSAWTNKGWAESDDSESGTVTNEGTLYLTDNSIIHGDVIQNAGLLSIDDSVVEGVIFANGGRFDITSGGAKAESLAGSADGQLEGTLNLTKAQDTYSGNISGTGNLTISGGTETLAGHNTYSGNTDIAQGAGLVLKGGLGGPLNNSGTTDIDGGKVAGKTTNNSTMTAENATLADVVNQSGANFSAAGGQITSLANNGDATLNQGAVVTDSINQQAGELTLDDAQVKGVLVANGGHFTVEKGGFYAGSLTGTANGQLDGTLNLTNAQGTYVGVLSGNGGLTVSGGQEILTANNSYTGPTLVQTGGQLEVDGDNSAAKGLTSVTDGSTLRGKGTIGGDVNIGSGATLAAGSDAAPATLTVNGNLNLAEGSKQVFRLGQTDTAGGAYNDFVDVKGNLALGGTLSIQPTEGGPNVSNSSLMEGLYRLYSYGGVLSGTQQHIDMASQALTTGLILQTSIDHQVNLAVRTNGFNYWDGDNSSHRSADGAGNDKVDGGDGVWSAASPQGTPNWATSDGVTNAQWQAGSMAIFAASAGTVTVDDKKGEAPVSFSGAQFANNDGKQYLVTGDNLYASTDKTVIRVGDGTSAGKDITAEIASVIDGSHVDGGTGLDKTDLGTLILTSDNNFAKPTQVEAGTLQLGNGGTTGSLGQQDIVNNGILAVDHSNDVTLSQAISGSGSVVQKGSGTTTLSGANSYAGDTDVQNGRLNLTGSLAGNLNNVATTVIDGGKVAGTTTNKGTLTAQQGTLADVANQSGTATLTDSTAGHVTNADGATFSATGGTLASAENSGSMTLGKDNHVTGYVTNDKGNLTLDGNQIAGVLAANGGQFNVTGNGSTVGSLAGSGNGVVNGTLNLTNAKDSYAGSLSGNGGLTLSGGGHETLTNQSHLGGSVSVDDGTLALTGANAHLTTDGGMKIGAGKVGELTLSGGAAVQSHGPIVFAKAETAPADGFNAKLDVLDGSTLSAGDANGKPGLDAEEGSKAQLTLDGGTLQNQKGADLTNAVDTSIGSKGAVFDVQDQNYMTLGSNVRLTDDGSDGSHTLTKTGTGTFIFAGDGSDFSGPTDIQSGQMIVDGNMAHSAMTVQHGGFLAGNGYVGSTLVSEGATLGAGDEKNEGGLHINGDLTMAKGSVLFVRGDNEATGKTLTGPGDFSYSELKSDRILVSGKADIQGGTLDLQVKNPMGLHYGQAYRVLSANGGVNGHYDDLKTNLGQDYAYLDPHLVYQGDDVDVMLRRSLDAYDSVGQTRNEITTGQGMNRIAENSQLAQAMTVLTKDQARHALDNLSGELHASIRTG
ncbi:autotransporter-associated beta strand repeat-containing protein, partial [Acetobacteraceae bacterium B3987]|nr:autotransporter-associated beta strand repeat-containing protein [Acetobacteraceae bacterium B3987]